MNILTVSRVPGNRSRGLLRFGSLTFPCALGRSGIGIFKREGDGRTPLGSMRILHGFFRHGVNALHASLPMRPISRRDGWGDQPWDSNYNRLLRLPCKASHERMWRDDALYDAVIVLDWNFTCRRQGMGSAIFMHIARPGYLPTEGCVALSRRDMLRLLPHLRAGMRLVVR